MSNDLASGEFLEQGDCLENGDAVFASASQIVDLAWAGIPYEFLESAEVHGNHYGTAKKVILDAVGGLSQVADPITWVTASVAYKVLDSLTLSLEGRNLADAIAKLRPGMKVLYTSGYTDNAVVHHGRLDEGVLLLTKPYRRPQLAKMVRQALGGGT